MEELKKFSAKTESVFEAMDNPLLRRQILLWLPAEALLRLRCVSRIWNNEIVTILQEFKQCNINIPISSPCEALAELNLFIQTVSRVPYN